jgi:RimJ/RimL family protein N-acetyltransferase
MSLTVPVLPGRVVRLEPLAEAHREGLRQAADDERIWRHTLTVARGDDFGPWFDEALARQAAGTQAPFAVRRRADQSLIGSTSYLDLQLRHKRLEIGSTWYVPAEWGTAVNPECKLLLLEHAFEVLGVNRVALITDRLNERSQAAIAKLGAVREGLLRGHMISQGGRVRDTVVFSVIAGEWPGVKERLLARLAAQSD